MKKYNRNTPEMIEPSSDIQRDHFPVQAAINAATMGIKINSTII
jgi:hypothetical protein